MDITITPWTSHLSLFQAFSSIIKNPGDAGTAKDSYASDKYSNGSHTNDNDTNDKYTDYSSKSNNHTNDTDSNVTHLCVSPPSLRVP